VATGGRAIFYNRGANGTSQRIEVYAASQADIEAGDFASMVAILVGYNQPDATNELRPATVDLAPVGGVPEIDLPAGKDHLVVRVHENATTGVTSTAYGLDVSVHLEDRY